MTLSLDDQSLREVKVHRFYRNKTEIKTFYKKDPSLKTRLTKT